ncbi:NADAR family protein [Micromonosporaceae bacterium Da 78-11]
MTITDHRPITEFRGPYAFLSNFHPAPLIWEGITYPTSEHAFNAGKTLDPDVRRQIAAAVTPQQAKTMGRAVKLRPLWDASVRYEVMREVLWTKFTSHPGRIDALLGTGDAELVENNHHHDMHWGRCLCSRHNGVGDNHLGRLLMELRAKLAKAAS